MDYVRRTGGLKRQLDGRFQPHRAPAFARPVEFLFELGDIKYNRSGNTVIQLIVPHMFGDVNLELQRAMGLVLKAVISKVDEDVPDPESK